MRYFRWRNGKSDLTSFLRFGALFSIALGCAVIPALAGDHFRQDDFQGRPSLVVSNDLLELTILNTSGAFASLVLKDDADKINPLWDHIRMARELNRPMWSLTYVGHFICVDGFGPPSDDEEKAGLPQHGEARDLAWTTESAVKKGKIAELVQAVHLPRVQEMLRRTIRVVDGENVVYVSSTLENLLTFDRPINWAEHGTIGSPFFEPGTVVDLSADPGNDPARPNGYEITWGTACHPARSSPGPTRRSAAVERSTCAWLLSRRTRWTVTAS